MSEEKKQQLEYVAMDKLGDDVEKLNFLGDKVVLDFAGAVNYALKKNGRKKLLVSSDKRKKETHTIKEAFRKNFPKKETKRQFIEDKSNGYMKVIIPTESDSEVYTEISLPERIVNTFIDLSKESPETNSMFLFGKSLAGKRKEPASDLHLKIAKSKKLNDAITEVNLRKEAEKEIISLRKEANKSLSSLEDVNKEIKENGDVISELVKTHDSLVEKLAKTRDQKDIDKLHEQIDTYKKQLKDTNKKIEKLLDEKNKMKQEIEKEIKNIEQARKDFPKDMQDLFDTTEYKKELKTSTQAIDTKVKPLLALTWDGPKGPRIEDVD